MLVPFPIPNHVLDHPLLEEKGLELVIKRLDLVHPEVSGNKFYKLKYNLAEAQKKGLDTLLTFGGAFSNHIYATAKAASSENLNAIGIIRGDKITPLNPTLQAAEESGMELHFISREAYRKKTEIHFIQDLREKFGDFYLIPEGGTNELAIKGTSQILDPEAKRQSHIAVSIGTGGTFSGLAKRISKDQFLMGFSSLKGNFIHVEIDQMLKKNDINPSGSYSIFDQYHFGGYGKYTQELIEFIWWFYEKFGIPLDPIYTGKLMFGIWDLIKKDYFKAGSKILAIHTGGLQGNRGFTKMTGIKLPPPSM
ncbi:pyridoxal-phosphate dependent enzyme [Algoriphagus sp. CAU 1675]|uniref:1-aminocyclopropane-1-carboxylate deaminase/D-cysteine desulfhydrase n=1 Tax=Algoriphagus sp. CAU 1675 TaxID=3032597 RepID=UPI0023DCD04F|nr:pyridoxal-phosphate dependent enzyme [Algoriphagus sp. CAU 1675]MDF2158940.1 pyridoxal-phosphate dependent enzyme [Algoriphagus sp. CAU 1675]